MASEKSDAVPEDLPTLSHPAAESFPQDKSHSVADEKASYARADVESTQETEESDDAVLQDARDIATHVISIDDDPSANPWTFRSFFIGIGLSAFGGVLAEIYYFKPQTVLVSTMFLAIIAYIVWPTLQSFHSLYAQLLLRLVSSWRRLFLTEVSSAT